MKPTTISALALVILLASGGSANPDPQKAALIAARDKAVEATVKEPKSLAHWKRLANLQRQLGDEKGTEEALNKALELDPKDAGVHFMLGLLYEKREEWARASAAFRACLENAGKDPIKEICVKHLRRTEKP